MYSSTCNLDYLGVCDLANLASVLIGLIGSFVYLGFIYGLKTKVKSINREKSSIFSYVITSFVVLTLSFTFYTVGRDHIYREIKENRERAQAITIANKKTYEEGILAYTAGKRDLCPEAPTDFFLSYDSGKQQGALNFPKGFIDAVGYVFVTYENYWDGELTADGYDSENNKKYTITDHDEYADFSSASMTSLYQNYTVRNGRFIISKKFKYDIRIAAFTDPEIQRKIVNKQLLLKEFDDGVYLVRRSDMYHGKEVPIKFSPVFPNNASCITVSVK